MSDKMTHVSKSTLANEAEIVWFEDPSKYPYLREEVFDNSTRTRPSRKMRGDGQRVIGYANLKPDAKPSGKIVRYYTEYLRRRWYFQENYDPYPFGPSESVIPSSIKAGEYSDSYNLWWADERAKAQAGEAPHPDYLLAESNPDEYVRIQNERIEEARHAKA